MKIDEFQILAPGGLNFKEYVDMIFSVFNNPSLDVPLGGSYSGTGGSQTLQLSQAEFRWILIYPDSLSTPFFCAVARVNFPEHGFILETTTIQNRHAMFVLSKPYQLELKYYPSIGTFLKVWGNLSILNATYYYWLF